MYTVILFHLILFYLLFLWPQMFLLHFFVLVAVLSCVESLITVHISLSPPPLLKNVYFSFGSAGVTRRPCQDEGICVVSLLTVYPPPPHTPTPPFQFFSKWTYLTFKIARDNTTALSGWWVELMEWRADGVRGVWFLGFLESYKWWPR